MRRVLIFIGIVVSLCSVWSVAAQTPDPRTLTQTATSTPFPLDVDYTTEVAFPHQVFFKAYIRLSIAELASTSLIIETSSGTRVEVTYPEEPYLYTLGDVIATYVWEIPRDNVPALFTPIRYTWRFVTNNDEVFEEVQTIEFTDERVEWQTITALNDALVLTAPTAMARSIRPVQFELTETLRLLEKNTGQMPQVQLLLYDEATRPGCHLNTNRESVYNAYSRDGLRSEQPCDLTLADAIYQKSNYSVVQIGTDRSLISALTSPLVRETYLSLWAGKSVPLWFAEGLEQFYQRQTNQAALFTSREALRSDASFTLQQMNQRPAPDNAIVWNAQAYGMVLYIASRAGVENIFALTRDIAGAESFEAAFQARMGYNTQSLVGAWQTWIFKREAENAFLYTPYLATTPTPTLTPTFTVTPVPPTPTLTPTATIELSPTPGVTITRRPPTPTLTPLPAQSFDLRPTPIPPTPLPVRTTLDILTQGNNPLIIGGGVLAVLLVIVVSLFTGRRRG